MRKFFTLLTLFIAATAMVSAQDTDRDRVVQSPLTWYNGLKVELATLEEKEDVVSVHLPDERGERALHSFDSVEEALDAMTEKLGESRATLYCICYEHKNYGGDAIIFYGYDVNSLKDLGWNDKISSYYCSPGAYMSLYEHKNWGGAVLANVSLSNANIHTIGWGDKASSLTFSF